MKKLASESGNTTQVSIVVSSCDAYSDIWDALSESVRHNWSDCPWPRYLLTNFKEAPEGFHTLTVGEDITWSRNLIVALERIDTEYVLLTVDDLILNEQVDTAAVLADAGWAARHAVAALQMAKHEPVWSFLWRLGGSKPVRISRGSTYRASTVFTLWNREFLLRLLDPAENAWQFEYQGSERIPAGLDVYVSNCRRFHFINAVIKGKITRPAAEFFRQHGYSVPSARKTMSSEEQRSYDAIYRRSLFFKFVPPFLRRELKRVIYKSTST